MAAFGRFARVDVHKIGKITCYLSKHNKGSNINGFLKSYTLCNSASLSSSSSFTRQCSTGSNNTQRQPSSQEPFLLVENHLKRLCEDIKLDIQTSLSSLKSAADYHFDGQGKAFRPMIVMLTAMAFNYHNGVSESTLLAPQRKVAQIAEMIHVASLVHDDVIDAAETRRGKPSVMHTWGQRKAVLAGDYIISMASMALARIGNEEVVTILSQVLEDLVRGEFMQLGSKEDESERFNHYLRKTYKKTASLIANSCKAVAILGQSDVEVADIAWEYGKNIGIAFQLVDDLLDFVSTEEMMGKPAADLKLGLATAPVLFAAQQHPELNALIMRRFSQPGDVETARHYVTQSDGVAHTRLLAEKHAQESIRQISRIKQSRERDALVTVTQKVLNRLK